MRELIEEHFVRSWSTVGAAAGGFTISTDEYSATLSALDHIPYNHVQRCTPTTDPDVVIDKVLDELGPHDAIWSVPPSSAAFGMSERLVRRGFGTYSNLTGMSLDLRNAKSIPDVPPDVRVVEAGLEDLELYADIVLESWHLSAADRATLLRMNRELGFEQMRRWLCYSGGRAVAKGVAFLHEPTVAGVYGVGTLPDTRGRGFATAVMSELLKTLRDDGVETVVLQSTPMAIDLYRRLGFVEHCEIPVYTVPRTETPSGRLARI